MSEPDLPFAVTRYGFKWGPAQVERLASHEGSVVLSLLTDTGRRLQLYVSPTGRSVRIYERGKQWRLP